MADVLVRQAHTEEVQTAKMKLGDFSELLQKYGVTLAWSGDRASIKGIGVSGHVVVSSDQVEVLVKLGMMARVAGIDAKRLHASIARRLSNSFD